MTAIIITVLSFVIAVAFSAYVTAWLWVLEHYPKQVILVLLGFLIALPVVWLAFFLHAEQTFLIAASVGLVIILGLRLWRRYH